jgi:hypothetical protein
MSGGADKFDDSRPMPNDGREYGLDTMTNTWVPKPNDGPNYGWNSTLCVWVPQEDAYHNVWHPDENKWVHYWSPSDDEDEDDLDGWNQETNEWVPKPIDGRNYGWHSTTHTWVPQEDLYCRDWNSDIGRWVHYQSFSDDEFGSDNETNHRDYQAEADDEEDAELAAEGLRRIGNRVIPYKCQQDI